MSYADYKMRKAMRVLSESNGQRRKWLASAEFYLFSRLGADEVPAVVRPRFSAFRELVGRLEARCDTRPLYAALDHLSDGEAEQLVTAFEALHAAWPAADLP
ncbi:MAG TPA: hypothetical protein VEC01_19915 [Noviherbaspirillum sp.]|uniref:hypothetical protein n=1 Tax=Noviherbaspirillum sp. TaxID=1926288 RepID=UPI002D3C21E6|nr:hypothetical protein [Noviherbaspirillum sp.]HYD97597.1 hypothetical protein [Noviherbaspirillum sp.]